MCEHTVYRVHISKFKVFDALWMWKYIVFADDWTALLLGANLLMHRSSTSILNAECISERFSPFFHSLDIHRIFEANNETNNTLIQNKQQQRQHQHPHMLQNKETEAHLIELYIVSHKFLFTISVFFLFSLTMRFQFSIWSVHSKFPILHKLKYVWSASNVYAWMLDSISGWWFR